MKIAFVGMGRSVVSWYRCALPAMYLGVDWLGLAENEGEFHYVTGLARLPYTGRASLQQYDIIVWQQPRSSPGDDSRRSLAMQTIRELRANGTKVMIEVDDYLHGVRKMKDHDFREAKDFSKKELEKFERAMSMSDGLICSTEWLAMKYRQYAPQTWVCLNGLDLGRYHKSRPKHDTVNIGWSGATGHAMSFAFIRKLIDEMLRRYESTTFISIGQGFAQEWADEFGQQTFPRILSLPFSSVEVYPNAMSMFDIGLAPAREAGWYRAKSALRYYEHCALGIPTIGSSVVYADMVEGTGFVVDTEDEWREAMVTLIEDDDLRAQMGRNAYEYAERELDMKVRKQQWERVFSEVAA